MQGVEEAPGSLEESGGIAAAGFAQTPQALHSGDDRSGRGSDGGGGDEGDERPGLAVMGARERGERIGGEGRGRWMAASGAAKAAATSGGGTGSVLAAKLQLAVRG